MKPGLLNRAKGKKAKAKQREKSRAEAATSTDAPATSEVPGSRGIPLRPIPQIDGATLLDDPNLPKIYHVTLPSRKKRNAASNQGEFHVECLFSSPGPIQTIVNARGFPGKLPRIETAHREIPFRRQNSGKRLGMYASRNLNPFELVFSERPIMIIPAATKCPPKGMPSKDAYTLDKLCHSEAMVWEEKLEIVYDPLDRERKDAFMELPYMVKEGESEDADDLFLLRRVWTNAFAIPQLQDPDIPGREGASVGICKVLSHVRHSCTPNATWTFDLRSLSYQLWAIKDINSGDEITISYVIPTDPYLERRRILIAYGFKCQCKSCQSAEEKDKPFKAIVKSARQVDSMLSNWKNDESEPDFIVMINCMNSMNEMLKHGCLRTDLYAKFLEGIFGSAVALGNEMLATKFSSLMCYCLKLEVPLLEHNTLVKQYNDMNYIRSLPTWGTRKSTQPLDEDSANLLNMMQNLC